MSQHPTGGSKHLDILKQMCQLTYFTSPPDYQKSSLRDLTVEEMGGEDAGDEDVKAERKKVKDIEECNVVFNQPVVLLQNLSKIYNKGEFPEERKKSCWGIISGNRLANPKTAFLVDKKSTRASTSSRRKIVSSKSSEPEPRRALIKSY